MSNEEVREASTQFYNALTRTLNGEAGGMAGIWSHSAAATAMHPIDGREVGWDAVRCSFEQVAKLSSAGTVELKDQFIQIDRDMAYEVGVEHGRFDLAGRPIAVEQRVTNIYQRQDGTWKIVHHHSDVCPAMLDVLRSLDAPPGQEGG